MGARTWFGNDPNFDWSLASIGIVVVMIGLAFAWQGIKERRKNRRWRSEEAAKAGMTLSAWPHGSKGRHKR